MNKKNSILKNRNVKIASLLAIFSLILPIIAQRSKYFNNRTNAQKNSNAVNRTIWSEKISSLSLDYFKKRA